VKKSEGKEVLGWPLPPFHPSRLISHVYDNIKLEGPRPRRAECSPSLSLSLPLSLSLSCSSKPRESPKRALFLFSGVGEAPSTDSPSEFRGICTLVSAMDVDLAVDLLINNMSCWVPLTGEQSVRLYVVNCSRINLRTSGGHQIKNRSMSCLKVSKRNHGCQMRCEMLILFELRGYLLLRRVNITSCLASEHSSACHPLRIEL